MEDKINSMLSVTPIKEGNKDFIDNYKEIIEKVEKDPNYARWYETFQNNEKLIGSLNESLLNFVYMDEHIPGEVQDSEYAYINNQFQIPLQSRLLRNAGKTEGARLIKNTRRLQFTEYARASTELSMSGLALRFADRDYKPSAIEKANLKEFNYKFCKQFFFPPFERKANFIKFLGVAYEDFFDLDDITFEIRRSVSGVPLGFHLTDPTIVHHVIPKKTEQGPNGYDNWMVDNMDMETQEFKPSQKTILDNMREDKIRYVMIKDNKRIAKFTERMIIKSHFFRTSAYHESRRGSSIVEQGIRALSGIMKAITYNSANFDNNRTPAGVFTFQGGIINRVAAEQFKKVLYAYLSGAQNRWRLPVLGLPEKGDAKFIPFNENSRDMEFHLWITLLFTILCQLSGTNPEEISMSSQQSAMAGKKLFDEKPDGILQVSKDKGLHTFLRYFEGLVNQSDVLKEMTNYRIEAYFRGLEVEDERIKIDVLNSKLKSSASYNDIIEAEGGEAQSLNIGGFNVYDIKGPEAPMVTKAIDHKMQMEKEELALRKQEMEAQNQEAANVENQGGGEGDMELVKKYGSPNA